MGQTSPLKVKFQKDTLLEKTGGIGISIIDIENTSNKAQSFTVNFEGSSDYRFLNRPRPEYFLLPGKSLLVPVRIYLNRDLGGGQILDIIARTESVNKEWAPLTVSGKIKVIENNLIFVYPINNKVFYYLNQNFAMLELQLENRGNIDAKIRIDFSEEKGFTSSQNNKLISLPYGTDTIIYISLKPSNERKATQFGNTTLTLNVKDSKNDLISIVNFEVVPITSVKKFSDPLSDSYLPNTAEIWGNGFGTSFIYHTFRAYGNLRLKEDARLNYRVQSLYFANNQRLFVREAQLNYAKANYKIGIGDQNEFFEKNLFGRGVKAETKTSNGTFTGLVLLNQYKSFQGDKKSVENLTSIMGKHKYELDAQNTVTSAIIQQFNGQTKTNSSLLVTEYEVRPSKKDYIKIRAGIGAEQHYGNRTNQLIRFGAGTGVDYVRNIRKTNIRLVNYYSTPSYAASRRGELQLSERIFYKYSEKEIIGGGLIIRRSDPNLYFNGERIRSVYQYDQSIEFFYSLTSNSNSLVFKPAFKKQSLDDFTSRSFRTLTEFKSNGNQGLNYFTSADLGFARPISVPLKPFFTTQIKANLSYLQYGISNIANVGPYYIFEQYLYSLSGRYPINLNVSPYASFSFLESKLSLLLIGNYYIDNIQKTGRRSIGSTFTYYLPSNYSLSLKTDFISSSLFSRFEAKVGVKKNFNKIRLISHTLSVILFADSNGNWIQDENEPAKSGAIVSVNGLSFITDKNGRIIYKKLPKGEYRVSIVDGQGWYLPTGYQTNYRVRKTQEVKLPLINGVGLTGKVMLTKVKYSKEQAIKLSGIKITATDPKGKVYETLTGSRGDFNFFLPLNNYDVKIYKNSLGSNFEFRNENLQVNLNDKNRAPLVFEVTEKSRRLKVKKFNSTGSLIEKNYNEIEASDTLILYYDVKPRETINQVGKKFNMKIDDLISLNNLREEEISFGQRLKVYYFYDLNNIIAYQVRSSDDIFSISKEFKMSPEELLALNGLKSYSIKTGQIIKVVNKNKP